jgi:hypothetical protein
VQNNKHVSEITVKLEPSVEINNFNHENESDAQLLWTSIKENFASEQQANKA